MGRAVPRIMTVIDLETTCYYGNDQGPQEIIEIGLCELDLSEDEPVVGNKRSILVKPVSKISAFCTELTTITQEMLDEEGIPLPAALYILKKEYDAKNRVWASWGDFDRNMFVKACKNYGEPYPFGPRHINLKCLFSVLNHYGHEFGMAAALEKVGLPLVGTHHRGHDDAENIAKIAQIMFRK